MRVLETPALSPLDLTLPSLVGGQFSSDRRWSDLPPLRLPLRTGPELLRSLLAGDSDLQLVEMLLLLDHLRLDATPGELAPGELSKALAGLWRQNNELRALTVAWLLPLRLDDHQAGSVLSSVADVAPEPIATLLGEAPFRVFAEACRANRWAPSTYARTLSVNVSPRVVHRIAWELVESFVREGPRAGSDQLLVREALTQVASDHFHERVSTVLTSLPPPKGTRTELPSFLQDRLDDGVLRREFLSPEAIRALPEWLGRLTFREFEGAANRLADLLDARETNSRKKPGGQLLSRVAFWSNYATRFTRFKLFLPGELASLREVQTALGAQREGVGLSVSCASTAVELAVFVFPDHIVVEPLVEPLETRVLPRSPRLEESLFHESRPLALSEIRVLGGTTLDHAYLWQHHSLATLRSIGVMPNPGLSALAMRSVGNKRAFTLPLKRDGTLPEPDAKKKADRDANLRRWRDRLQKAEREATAWMRSNQVARR